MLAPTQPMGEAPSKGILALDVPMQHEDELSADAGSFPVAWGYPKKGGIFGSGRPPPSSLKHPLRVRIQRTSALFAHQDSLRKTELLAKFTEVGSSAPQGPEKVAYL